MPYRRQTIRLNRLVKLGFSMRPGEFLSCQLEAITSTVPDFGGPVAVAIPACRPDEHVVVNLKKAGFVLIYGRFTAATSAVS